MAAANNNLHKYIVWGLLASTILFLILFILFTILFATKDGNQFFLFLMFRGSHKILYSSMF